MKISTACVVLAAVAAAAPASVVTEISETLIKIETLIKEAESKNYNVLSPLLGDIAREVHQGLDSGMFTISNGIRNTLIDVNIKVGHITDAIAVLSQIESGASFFNTFKHSNARRDFDMKTESIKRLLQVTLNMTTVVPGLIDETKDRLGKGVSGPLKMLQLTVLIASDDKLYQENTNIRRQQMTINNPPKWLFYTDHQAVAAAQAMKEQGETTVKRIVLLVAKILDHVTWLEGVCQTIRDELDSVRTEMSTNLRSKFSDAAGTVIVLDEYYSSSENLSDEEYREGSESLAEVMNQLRDEVRKVTSIRSRQAAEPEYIMERRRMEAYLSFADDFFQQI